MKHLEGLGFIQPIQEPADKNGKVRHFTSRASVVFDTALFKSDLCAADKSDVAQAYLDYLRESASNVAQIKSVQSKLREQNLIISAGG